LTGAAVGRAKAGGGNRIAADHLGEQKSRSVTTTKMNHTNFGGGGGERAR